MPSKAARWQRWIKPDLHWAYPGKKNLARLLTGVAHNQVAEVRTQLDGHCDRLWRALPRSPFGAEASHCGCRRC